jgi:hypothetical protein
MHVHCTGPDCCGAEKEPDMVGLAAAMFVGLFAFGWQFFGWPKGAHEELQLGLFLSFILGIICGYKTKVSSLISRSC